VDAGVVRIVVRRDVVEMKADKLEQQRHEARQTDLDQYPTEELIENLENRGLEVKTKTNKEMRKG